MSFIGRCYLGGGTPPDQPPGRRRYEITGTTTTSPFGCVTRRMMAVSLISAMAAVAAELAHDVVGEER
jgi:hypothetical protein